MPVAPRHRATPRSWRRLVTPLVPALAVVLAALGATALPASPAAATTPVRAVFYYPWFTETWHATDKFHPSAGQYSSDDRATVDRQMADLAYAGEQSVITSWWGQGTHKEQTRFPMLMDSAKAHGLTVTPYYEKEGVSDTSLTDIKADLAYLKSYEQANPQGFLHVDGKPVIFVYNAAASTSSCAAVTKWKQATNGFADWYVDMKVFSGFATCADQPSSWHQYGPASAVSSHLPYSYNVSPGFYQYAESAPRLARDLTRFKQNLADQVSSGAGWQLVTSYNEWGEGTAVESATEWASADGHGAYIDAMHDAYAATSTGSTGSTPTSSTSPSGSTPSPTSPGPATSSIAPAADDYVESDTPTKNFGGSSSLLVDNSPVRRSYVRFQLALPSTPTQVSLSLTALSKQSKGIVLHPSSSSWAENALTWNTAPAASTTVCGRSGPVTAGQRVTVVVDTAACPVPANGAVALAFDTPSSTNLRFGSRESSTPPALLVSTGSSTTSSSQSPTATTTSSSPSTTTTAPSPSTTTTAPSPSTTTTAPSPSATTTSPSPSATTTAPSPSATTTSPSPSTTPTSSPTGTPSGAVTKVLVFMEENHSLAEMQSGMPYTFGLAKQYGYATAYKGITHPSLPNYLAIAGGQTFGVTDDNGPSSHPINASTVFGQAIANGKTAKTYADGMTSNCMKSGTGKYVVRHNPWIYFTPTTESGPCASYDVPETQLNGDITNGTLPNVGMVVPDVCNDAHDCSLSVADSWFQTRMQNIFNGPDWKSGHLAVVLTADEDDSSAGNTVLTVVIHPSQNGHVVSTPLTHYSLTRLYEDVAGAPYLYNAATAPSMSTAFGLPMP